MACIPENTPINTDINIQIIDSDHKKTAAAVFLYKKPMEEKLRIFPYLEVDMVNREVRYLGYALKLTDCEYEVLKALVWTCDPIDKYAIKSYIDNDCAAKVKISVQSVPVHICAINQKAMIFGGRKIVILKRKVGYLINELM